MIPLTTANAVVFPLSSLYLPPKFIPAPELPEPDVSVPATNMLDGLLVNVVSLLPLTVKLCDADGESVPIATLPSTAKLSTAVTAVSIVVVVP